MARLTRLSLICCITRQNPTSVLRLPPVPCGRKVWVLTPRCKTKSGKPCSIPSVKATMTPSVMHGSPTNEPSTFLNTLRTGDSENSSKFSDAAYDKALDDALQASDKAQVGQYYQQAEDILSTQVPVIPLYQYVSAKLVKPYIGGYDNQSPLGYIYAKDLYVIKH